MKVDINPKTWTNISSGSCTVKGTSSSELVRFREGNKEVTESYLNSPVIILSEVGIQARSNQKNVSIDVEDL